MIATEAKTRTALKIICHLKAVNDGRGSEDSLDLDPLERFVLDFFGFPDSLDLLFDLESFVAGAGWTWNFSAADAGASSLFGGCGVDGLTGVSAVLLPITGGGGASKSGLRNS